MSQCDRLLLAKAISSRSRVPDSLYPTCGRTLHIGFFFESPGHDGFLLHMRYYIRWLANIWNAYNTELQKLDEREESLYQSQFSDSSWFAKTLGLGSETARQREARLEQTSAIHQRREELHSQFHWLNEVDKEARDMRSRRRVYGEKAAGTRKQLEVWMALLAEWFDPLPMESETADLFAFFVHDQQVLSTTQRHARWWAGENFFDIRGFDRPRGSLPTEPANTQDGSTRSAIGAG